jgi:hypothetical protein
MDMPDFLLQQARISKKKAEASKKEAENRRVKR